MYSVGCELLTTFRALSRSALDVNSVIEECANLGLKQSIARGVAILPSHFEANESCASSHQVRGLRVSVGVLIVDQPFLKPPLAIVN